MKLPTRHAFAGFLVGLVAGLGVAGAAAIYLTAAPLPFVNKVQPSTENITPVAQDPNKPLFSAHIPTAAAGAGPDAAAVGTAAPVVEAPAPAGAAAAAGAPAAGGADDSRFLLQVGAYKSSEDADAARARLALIGLDGKVTQVQSDGTTVFRVRLGPYGKLDDLDGIRRTLADNGIEAQLVHQK